LSGNCTIHANFIHGQRDIVIRIASASSWPSLLQFHSPSATGAIRMDSLSRRRVPSFIFALIVTSSLATSAIAGPIWENDWTYSSSPLLESGYTANVPTSPVDFSSDGEVVFSGVAESPFNVQVTRLDSAGNLRWVANLDNYGWQDYYEASSLIANDDGSAFVALGEGGSPKVARLSPTGTLDWIREVPAKWMAKLPGNRLAVRDCKKVAVLDAINGDVLWERNVVQNYLCVFGGLLADATGNVYVSFGESGLLHAIKYDALGDKLFDVIGGSAPAGQSGSLVAIDGSNFYIQAGADLRAFRQTDGALIWTIQPGFFSQAIVSKDLTPELVLVGSGTLTRLAADSGLQRWTRSLPNLGRVEAIANSILVPTGTSLTRLNANTGATDWSMALPSVSASGDPLHWMRFGGLANDQITGIARAYNVYKASPPFVQPIAYSSGNLLPQAPVATVAQGVYGFNTAGGTHVFSAAHILNSTGPEVRIRSVDAVTGATQWETIDTIPLEDQYFAPYPNPELSVGTDVVAVATTLTRYNGSGPYESAFQVALYDRSTGNKLWSVPIYEPSQTGTNSSGPEIDADGNVYYEVNVNVPCDSSTCAHTRLYKFSRLDGSVLWTEDQAGNWLRTYKVFGNDVVRAGSIDGSGKTLLRLSGVDGSEQWSSSLFAADGTYFDFDQVDSQYVIFSSSLNTAKVDVNTGMPVWTAANVPFNCTNICYTNDVLTLPNGAQLSTGSDGPLPLVRYYHNDGSGIVDQWDLAPNSSQLSSIGLRVLSTPSGDVKMTIRRFLRSTSISLSFIATLDPATGTILGQQIMGVRPVDDGTESHYRGMIAWPADNLALTNVESSAPPAPATTGAALVDMTVAQHGDLSASLSIDNSVATAGQAVGFHMTVNYSGDLPLTSAHLLGYLPWQSGVSSLACSTNSASNCVVESRFGGLDATFDIQPGGSVTVDGVVHALSGDEMNYFGVGTYGPNSLSEPNAINNFARSTIIESLFRNGFD
jgi:hypothetical protein